MIDDIWFLSNLVMMFVVEFFFIYKLFLIKLERIEINVLFLDIFLERINVLYFFFSLIF